MYLICFESIIFIYTIDDQVLHGSAALDHFERISEDKCTLKPPKMI